MYNEEFAWGWCDLCVAEDYARTGQQYIHLEWTLACVGYCHRHKHRLTSHCACGAERRPIHKAEGARTRLVCRFCGRSVAQPGGEERYGPRRLVRARDLQLAFEVDLVAALGGRAPSSRWCGNVSADELLSFVDDICYALCTRRSYSLVLPIEGFWLKSSSWRHDRLPHLPDMDHKLCALSPYWRATVIGAVLAIIGDEDVCKALSIDLDLATEPFLRRFMKWRGSLEWMLSHLPIYDVRRLLERSVNWPEQVRERLSEAIMELRRTVRYYDRKPVSRLDHNPVGQ